MKINLYNFPGTRMYNFNLEAETPEETEILNEMNKRLNDLRYSINWISSKIEKQETKSIDFYLNSKQKHA